MTPSACEIETRLDDCRHCGQPLPLALPRPGESPVRWTCARCGAAYEAVLAGVPLAEALASVHPTRLTFDRQGLSRPPDLIVEFLVRLLREEPVHHERRQATRHALAVPVIALPMDSTFRPVDAAFLAVTRNISVTGLSLVHTRAVAAQLMVVELAGSASETMQFVMRVLRCRPLRNLYEIAGPFLLRLEKQD